VNDKNNKSDNNESEENSKPPIFEEDPIEEEPKSDHEVEKKEQIEIVSNKIIDHDEDLDLSTLHFFDDFIEKNSNHPIKEKVEKILNMFKEDYSNKKKLTNKLKNQILINMKTEYLYQLEDMNQKEEEQKIKRSQRKREEAVKRTEENINRHLRTKSQGDITLKTEEKRVKFQEEQKTNKFNEVKHTVENPFTDNLQDRYIYSKYSENNLLSPTMNKIIYTNKGWGILKDKKLTNNPTTKNKNMRYLQEKPKIPQNNRYTNTKLTNNSKVKPALKPKYREENFWLGNKLDESGEWVEL
jgi:hypothetical protein